MRASVSLFGVLLFIAMTSPIPAQPGSKNSLGPQLASTVFSWGELPVTKTRVGERRNVTESATATLRQFECHVTTLNPGEVSHAPHQHPQEELIILKEGEMEVTINGRSQRLSAGSMIFFAAFDLHAAKNVGAVPATYFVMNFVTAATGAISADSIATVRTASHLPSAMYDWHMLKVIPTAKGARRDFFDGPTFTCANLESHATTIRSGEIPHPSHRHPDEELVVVKEGTVEFTINGKAQTAGAGSIAFFASNDEHGLKNVGASDATYYIIRVLTPVQPTTAN